MLAGERRERCALCMLMGRLVAWPSPPPSELMLLLLGERAMPWDVALANGEMPGPSCAGTATEGTTVPGGGVTRPVPPGVAVPGVKPSARALARCDLMACSASASTFLRREQRGKHSRSESACRAAEEGGPGHHKARGT